MKLNKIHPLPQPPPPPPYEPPKTLINGLFNQRIVPVCKIENHFSLSWDVNDDEIVINVKDMLTNVDYIIVINEYNEIWKKINRFFQNNFSNLKKFIILVFGNNYNVLNYNIYYNNNNKLVFNISHNIIINHFDITLDFIILNNEIDNEIDEIINDFILQEKL